MDGNERDVSAENNESRVAASEKRLYHKGCQMPHRGRKASKIRVEGQGRRSGNKVKSS